MGRPPALVKHLAYLHGTFGACFEPSRPDSGWETHMRWSRLWLQPGSSTRRPGALFAAIGQRISRHPGFATNGADRT